MPEDLVIDSVLMEDTLFRLKPEVGIDILKVKCKDPEFVKNFLLKNVDKVLRIGLYIPKDISDNELLLLFIARILSRLGHHVDIICGSEDIRTKLQNYPSSLLMGINVITLSDVLSNQEVKDFYHYLKVFSVNFETFKSPHSPNLFDFASPYIEGFIEKTLNLDISIRTNRSSTVSIEGDALQIYPESINLPAPINFCLQPTELFGFIMSLPDSHLFLYFKKYADISSLKLADVERFVESNPLKAKYLLAYYITLITYGETTAQREQKRFVEKFSKGNLSVDEYIPIRVRNQELLLLKALFSSGFFKSKSYLQSLFNQGAVYKIINGQKILLKENTIAVSIEEVIFVGKRMAFKVEYDGESS